MFRYVVMWELRFFIKISRLDLDSLIRGNFPFSKTVQIGVCV
ncbi:hypothetical protein LBBP_02912 [Leptospira borgpetersenii serovar Ballum]|uniref:Uncharacterized protein n=1 Tax=Leptospira borgpetersenii serovar Ballum TaxID=280505 RepID=A0A0S2IU26_LEPBO|nr:hypothetical protein LBBP_02912 [Leptospira borgpetersenii serovar Ballum]